MTISRNGSRPTQEAPAGHFTGVVRVDPLFQSSSPARAGAAYVTFEPCARSDWHAHPLGQTLIVTFGCGLHQCWGGPIEEIRPGDVVTVGPNEKHWHGASPTTSMTHIAIQESLDGKAVEWLEKVTDDLHEGILEGRIEPGRVLDRVTDLDGVPDGYRAMHEREAIKVMVTFP